MRPLCFFLFLLSYSQFGFASQQGEAISHIKDAAYIQSGAKGFVGQLQSYGENKSKELAKKLYVDKIIAIGVLGYKTYQTKQVSFPIKGTKFTLTPNSIGVSLPL